MMREIKFRVRNTVSGGVDFVTLEYLMTNNQTNISPKGFREDLQVSQYTGLKDKNGVEIYEGDIIKPTKSAWCVDGIGMIAFSGGAFVNRKGDADRIFHGINSVHHEIIGNIYENPELIK